jgi:DNA polymerase alpha subunit A
MQLEVVYGDTDSIFINSGSDNLQVRPCHDRRAGASIADSASGGQEATRIANETKKELNKMWKLLEVGLDGIYCPLLLLNKKKYAALSVTERDGVITKVYAPSFEFQSLSLSLSALMCCPPSSMRAQVKEKKGLDIVRRDWCHLARRAGDKILDFILSGLTERQSAPC